MVVDGNSHISCVQILHGGLKFVLVVVWVYPQFVDVAGGVARILKTHQCNVFDKREISVDVVHQFGQSRNGQLVEYDPNLYADAMTRSLMETRHSLVKRAFCLNHIVVNTSSIRIKWDSEADIGILNFGKPPSVFRESKCSAVGEHVQFSCRHRLLELGNQSEQTITKERRLSPGDSQVRGRFFNQANQFKVALRQGSYIVLVLRWLGTHQTIAIATFSHK